MNLRDNFIYVVLFDREAKEFFLKDQDNKIDRGIRELCDAINSIDYLVTMNSCQGDLYEEEYGHCPKTYVDFYVLNHQYYIADIMLKTLVSVFGDKVSCTLEYEADLDIFVDEEGEEWCEENGLINYRYRIEMINVNQWTDEPSIETYKRIVEVIKEYSEFIKQNKEFEEAEI